MAIQFSQVMQSSIRYCGRLPLGSGGIGSSRALQSFVSIQKDRAYHSTLELPRPEGIPIRLVKEGEEATGVVAVRRVNELDFYSLGLNQVAEKINLTGPKALAVIRQLKLQEDEEYFRVITIGSSRFRRYSYKAVQRIREELPKLNLEEVWSIHRPKARKLRT